MKTEPTIDSSEKPGRVKFRAILLLDGKTTTGIQVPPQAMASLGTAKRIPIRVTIGDYTYRTTVAPYNGAFMISVSAENRAGAGIQAGDEVDVEIEVDNEPREVSVPADFAAALDRDADAKRFFDGLSYSNKRRFVLSIEEAKTDETRQRRIAKSISTLHEGKI